MYSKIRRNVFSIAMLALLGAGCATGAKKAPADPVAAQLKEIEDQAASKPDDSHAQYALGNAYFDRRRYAEARAAYLRATEIDPLYADAHSNIGLVYPAVSISHVEPWPCNIVPNEPTTSRLLSEKPPIPHSVISNPGLMMDQSAPS